MSPLSTLWNALRYGHSFRDSRQAEAMTLHRRDGLGKPKLLRIFRSTGLGFSGAVSTVSGWNGAASLGRVMDGLVPSVITDTEDPRIYSAAGRTLLNADSDRPLSTDTHSRGNKPWCPGHDHQVCG